MKSKIQFLSLPIVAMALALTACNEKSNPMPSTEKTCAELGDSLAAAAGSTTASYKVIRPNGGESYRVGDSLRIRATGNINAANASLYLLIGASKLVRPASLSGNLNLYSNCDMVFVIPDSLQTTYSPVTMISLVSDSVKIRVESYSFNSRNDLSDGYFRIQARSTP
jgi:hypothetical protein